MPTSPRSDLVTLRRETKDRLGLLKGDATFDEVIRALLDVSSEEAVRARLARTTAPEVRSVDRDPEEQVLLARLAARGWEQWRRTGRVVDVAPRVVSFRLPPPRKEVRIGPLRRGLPP